VLWGHLDTVPFDLRGVAHRPLGEHDRNLVVAVCAVADGVHVVNRRFVVVADIDGPLVVDRTAEFPCETVSVFGAIQCKASLAFAGSAVGELRGVLVTITLMRWLYTTNIAINRSRLYRVVGTHT
jgi:hypothetical protein